MRFADRDMTLPRFILRLREDRSDRSEGALRISLGIASNFRDVYRFFRFAEGLLNRSRAEIGGISAAIDNCRVVRDGS